MPVALDLAADREVRAEVRAVRVHDVRLTRLGAEQHELAPEVVEALDLAGGHVRGGGHDEPAVGDREREPLPCVGMTHRRPAGRVERDPLVSRHRQADDGLRLHRGTGARLGDRHGASPRPREQDSDTLSET